MIMTGRIITISSIQLLVRHVQQKMYLYYPVQKVRCMPIIHTILM